MAGHRGRRPGSPAAGALGSDAREEQDGARQQAPGFPDRARMGRADNGANAGQAVFADEVFTPLRDHPRDVLPEHAAVAQRYVLDVAAALVRGLDEAEDPAALPTAGAEE